MQTGFLILKIVPQKALIIWFNDSRDFITLLLFFDFISFSGHIFILLSKTVPAVAAFRRNGRENKERYDFQELSEVQSADPIRQDLLSGLYEESAGGTPNAQGSA